MFSPFEDLKLENLLLSTNEKNSFVKICDFGCAKEIKNSKDTARFK